jgi:LacI family transcriptional regulator
VPDDCSVIGFDDVAMAAYYNPPLTTVRQPMETMGSISVAILLEAIRTTLKKNAIKPVHRKVVPRLMIRESTASPAGK